jgi:hypothetical protein
MGTKSNLGKDSISSKEMRKSLSDFHKKVVEIDKRYSDLDENLKSLKKKRFIDSLIRIIIQILLNHEISGFLKDESDSFIEFVKGIISKIH